MSDHGFEYRKLGSIDEAREYARIIDTSFLFPEEAFVKRLEIVGTDGLRGVLVDGKPAGVLILIPMGQFFGGKSVPMTGVALVGVPPEMRGRGVATWMMIEAVREMQAEGPALSTLFPATLPLYRRAGYENAGRWYQFELKIREMRIREKVPGIEFVPLEGQSWEEMVPSYTEFAKHQNGMLDRGPYLWNRVRTPRGDETQGYLVKRNGKVEGHIAFRLHERDLLGYGMTVADMVANTPEAGHALLTFLCDHKSLGYSALWSGCPDHPLFMQFPDHGAEIKDYLSWMVRVLNVPAALEARGYPAGLSAELHLDLVDDLLPVNTGRWVLSVANGSGSVAPGGAGRLRTTVRDFASLYTGFLSPWSARNAGRLEGSDDDLEKMAAVFGGITPWMSEIF